MKEKIQQFHEALLTLQKEIPDDAIDKSWYAGYLDTLVLVEAFYKEFFKDEL